MVALLAVLAMTTPPPAVPDAAVPPPAGPTAHRLTGPGGSLLLVEESHVVPLVQVVVAFRAGAALDPGGREGLTYLAAELARHGAGTRNREQLDAAFDALGASLDVDVDVDSVRFVGHVLARNVDAFLALLGDVLLRPRFDADELDKTRRELAARIEEMRTDDPALCARFFARRLYGVAHGYGRPPVGTKRALSAFDGTAVRARWKSLARGGNVVFAFAGDVQPAALGDAVARHFGTLAPGAPTAARLPDPRPPRGWRIQLVDKPERQQVQIMFGQVGLAASNPDYLPLALGLAAFGGPAFNATLMDEVRTKRGLAYGAYMQQVPRRSPGPIRAHLSTGGDRAVTALKLVLKLYGKLPKDGLTEKRVGFFRDYLMGSHAADMDDPARRLLARVQAELHGLPPDHVDTLPARLRAVTAADVNRALRAHLHPQDLAITLVATAGPLVDKLVASGIDRGAIDVVPWDAD